MIVGAWLLLWLQSDLAPPVRLQREIPAARSCPAEGEPVVRRLAPGGVRYCGRIDAAGVRRVATLLERGDTRLVITSEGGALDAPLDLARLVLRHGLDVEIAGPCFSGCASLVFMSGTRRIVGPTGVLGFHNTNSSALLLASRIYGSSDVDLADLQRRSAEEMTVYARRGIDPTLLLRPQLEIGTTCVMRAGAAPSGESIFNLESRLDLWAPDLATLRAFGVELSGDYPAGIADLQRRLVGYLGRSGRGFRFSFGGPAMSGRTLYRRLYGIGPCPPVNDALGH